MASCYLENKRRVLTCLTSYLLCSFLCDFCCISKTSKARASGIWCRFGWALLWCSTQISPLNTEVAGVWPVMEGEGRQGRRWRESREERQGGEDETRTIRWSVEIISEWWWWYLGCEKDISLLCLLKHERKNNQTSMAAVGQQMRNYVHHVLEITESVHEFLCDYWNSQKKSESTV